jgi:predicted AAA+ superfamily ATPase
VLVDTLVGSWLPAWQPRVKVREAAHPKFYLFDPGVARAAAGRLRAPLHDTERGPVLETWILHELRAHLAHAGAGGELSYYRTPAGVEVDFVWSGPERAVGIEVKAAKRWRPADGVGLRDLHARGAIRRAIGIYGGEHALRDGPIQVFPIKDFLDRLPELVA